MPSQINWHKPSGLVALSLINFILRVLTLGIYGFWAKAEVRKRIWSAIRLEGQPLQYTGTGGELFLGFLIVFFIVIVPIMLTSVGAAVAFGPDSAAYSLYSLLLYAVFFLLIGIAIYRATRYRLSRTRWRGIRGSLTGSVNTYAWTHFWTGLLVPLTLGWIMPWRTTKLQSLITNATRFGDRPFRFNAGAARLYAPFAALWIGSVIIVMLIAGRIAAVMGYELAVIPDDGATEDFKLSSGSVVTIIALILAGILLYAIVSAWYRARQFNHFAAHTHIENARFAGDMTGFGLMWISLSNFLIVIFSLGILSPIAQARAAGYAVNHLTLVGELPFDSILQSAETAPSRGEGLAQVFDIDAF